MQVQLVELAMRQVKLKDVVDFVAATLASNGARAVLNPSVETALAPVKDALSAAVQDASHPNFGSEDGSAARSLITARLSAMAEPRLGAVAIEVGAACRITVTIGICLIPSFFCC